LLVLTRGCLSSVLGRSVELFFALGFIPPVTLSVCWCHFYIFFSYFRELPSLFPSALCTLLLHSHFLHSSAATIPFKPLPLPLLYFPRFSVSFHEYASPRPGVHLLFSFASLSSPLPLNAAVQGPGLRPPPPPPPRATNWYVAIHCHFSFFFPCPHFLMRTRSVCFEIFLIYSGPFGVSGSLT